MIEQINNELLKLQEELSKFDGAVSKITKAGQISDSIIESSKELQKYFSDNLEKINTMFSEFMNKTYSHTENKINELYYHFQERVQQEEKTLEKYTNLVEQNSEITQEYIKKTTEQNSEAINRIIDEAQKTLIEERDFVKLQIENYQTKINEIVNSHNERVKSEQKLLDNYLELASSTAELSKFLKTVDFPKKLDELKTKQIEVSEKNDLHFGKIREQNTNLGIGFEEHNTKTTAKLEQISADNEDLKSNINKILSDPTNRQVLENVVQLIKENKQAEILKNTAKVKSKIGGTQFFVILIFIFSVLFYAFFTFVFFTFFPHFFSDMM